MCVDGAKLPTGFESQELELTDPEVEVLASMEDGTPAVVLHRYGKGKTLYFNNFEGLVLLEQLYPQIEELVAGVIRDVDCVRAQKPDSVQLSYGESEAEKAILAVNFSGQSQTVRLTGLPADVTLRELFTGEMYYTERETVLELPPESHRVYCWKK